MPDFIFSTGLEAARAFRRWRLLIALGIVLFAAVASSARAAGSVYVSNFTSNDISQYDVGGGGVLAPKSPASVAAGTAPQGIAIGPDGRSAYVGNQLSNNVSQYDLGAGGGLTPKTPATVAAGTTPENIAVSPDGQSVYAVNLNDPSISEYSVDAAGILSPKSPATVATGSGPRGIAISPDGKSVYVLDSNADMVSEYDVGAGGTLTPKTPATVATGSRPFAIVITPDGRSAFVVNALSNNVSQFDVAAGGLLVAKTPATVSAGGEPFGLTVSPDGKSLYVANLNDNDVSEYDVGAGGTLAPKLPATIAAGTQPEAVALSPDGKSAYVTNFGGNSVSEYDVGANGVLSAKTPTAVPAGMGPQRITVTPDQSPTASFVATTGAAGTSSQFNGSASSDTDGTIAHYDWAFGDGTTLQNGGPTPRHTYPTPGTYTARLTVTDDAGCSTAFVYTGQTAYCNGNSAAITTRTFTVSPKAVAVASLSGLRVSPKHFSIAGREVKGRCVKPTKKNNGNKRCKQRIRLNVSYSLDGPTAVTLTIRRIAPGRTVNGRCVQLTSLNRKHKKCSRLVTVRGSIVRASRAGASSFTFNGKIGRATLGPGSYELIATPTAGTARTVTFNILP